MFGRKKAGSVRVSDVQLDEFVSSVLIGIAKGIKNADQKLQGDGAGFVYLGNISTHSDECVKLGLLKGDTQQNASSPVLAVQFEVSVAVQDAKSSSSSASGAVGTSRLSLITFEGSISAGSRRHASTIASQSLQFTVPLSMGESAQQGAPADRPTAAQSDGG